MNHQIVLQGSANRENTLLKWYVDTPSFNPVLEMFDNSPFRYRYLTSSALVIRSARRALFATDADRRCGLKIVGQMRK